MQIKLSLLVAALCVAQGYSRPLQIERQLAVRNELVETGSAFSLHRLQSAGSVPTSSSRRNANRIRGSLARLSSKRTNRRRLQRRAALQQALIQLSSRQDGITPISSTSGSTGVSTIETGQEMGPRPTSPFGTDDSLEHGGSGTGMDTPAGSPGVSTAQGSTGVTTVNGSTGVSSVESGQEVGPKPHAPYGADRQSGESRISTTSMLVRANPPMVSWSWYRTGAGTRPSAASSGQ
ncbi:hypothetical protein CC2G_002961 [Coprinopsis cinerea AmutBmut pab1-1]|nr:hypothetical protein CC2G_002961 [Coprinopsis cinerea AmutBmut pab1-1]